MELEILAQKHAGLYTLTELAARLGIQEKSARNVITKLKKAGYASAKGRKHWREYLITPHKIIPRAKGMYDYLNKYNPHFQLLGSPDHQVHGPYTVEDAIIDAIRSGSFRATLATLKLFNHVNDWKKLHHGAKMHGIWQHVGALYDTARLYMRVRRMPTRYRKGKFTKKSYLFSGRETKEDKLKPISKKWNVEIPLHRSDFHDVTVRYYTEKPHAKPPSAT
jgi:predicted transcriptional regulator